MTGSLRVCLVAGLVTAVVVGIAMLRAPARRRRRAVPPKVLVQSGLMGVVAAVIIMLRTGSS